MCTPINEDSWLFYGRVSFQVCGKTANQRKERWCDWFVFSWAEDGDEKAEEWRQKDEEKIEKRKGDVDGRECGGESFG